MSNRLFNLSGDEIKKLNIRLLYVSSAKYGGDWHSTVHSHHFTEMFYVIQGQGSFLVEDHKFHVKENDMVIVNPYINHTEVSLNAYPLEYIVLAIDGLAFFHDPNEMPNLCFHYNYENYKTEILFYLKALLKEVENQDIHFEYISQNLLEVLVLNIIRRSKYNINIASTKKMSKECSMIKNFIDLNFAEPITLDDLARKAHINKYYLVHAFNRYIGVSPINYLNERRIEESKILLSTTSYSIAQIANITGFSSQSYFAQAFRKLTHMTPNQYRKEKKQSDSK